MDEVMKIFSALLLIGLSLNCNLSSANTFKVGDVAIVEVGTTRTTLKVVIAEVEQFDYIVKYCDSLKFRFLYETGAIEGHFFAPWSLTPAPAGTICIPVN